MSESLPSILAFAGRAAVSLLAPESALAQTPASPDTARLYRREVGLTASPQLAQFFTANRSLPLGVFYQRQLSPTRFLRLRLVGQLSYADSTNELNGAMSLLAI